MNKYHIIKRPIVTEKSSNAQMQGKYTFIVANEARKIEIAAAVESLYKTKVASVALIKVPLKTRLIGRGKIFTKRQAAKKAIITLEKGKKIDILSLKIEKK